MMEERIVQLLRTMLFTPGNNWRMIQKAKDLPADAIILDLEDAVPMVEKETARIFVADGVQLIKSGGRQVFVRVNSLSTGLTEEDLEYSVQRELDGIVLAKTESSEDIIKVERIIEKLEKEKDLSKNHIKIIPLLETARGVMNVEEIVQASERVIAVCFGALDFTRDMGTTQSKEGTETYYARSRIVLGARAFDVQAIDTPWFDLIDQEGLIRETGFAKQLGYRGKLLIHPDHIKTVNTIFTPTEAEIEYAKRVVEAFNEAKAKGLGAISLNGKMIDEASYLQAENILYYARTIIEKDRNKSL